MLCLLIRRARPLVCRRVTYGRSLATRRSAAISEYVALPPEAADGLRSLGLQDAAPVQAAVWAEAMGGKSACVHAPTGSGKTLAYVLPAVARLRSESSVAVALAPTRELAKQVLAAVKRALRGGTETAILVAGGAGN